MGPRRINYAGIMDSALLSGVKRIFEIVSENGLYRKQHLYVTFDIRHPDVIVSDVMREDFDVEMSIILQYEFWDLTVDDFGFSVNLAFEHGDEFLYVPFASLISVSDPSENFCAEFSPDFGKCKGPQNGNSKNGPKSNVISLDKFRKGN